MNVLLAGNPNVGKSVIFTRLTGVRVISSNYPGTTIEFTEGNMQVREETMRLIDVPGSYSVEKPASKAEDVALKMLKEGDVIIDVVDATNLERNLQLTFELLELRKPMVIALNVWDDAKHKGIAIDCKKLEELLGVPVIPTVAITGEGIKELTDRLSEAAVPETSAAWKEDRWSEVGRIVSAVQSLKHRHHTFMERLADLSVKPPTGLPIAMVVLLGSFYAIRLVGEALIGYVTEPLFERLWRPVVEWLSMALGSEGFFHYIFVGNLVGGEIDFIQSFGLLTTGVFVPLAMVLPYILVFYLWLGLLEDLGYLPRLAVLLDTVMHRMGLHGWAIIPNLLGLGCNVPAVLATRILDSRRERLIAATIVSVGVPCAALQAMVWALVGDPNRGGGVQYVLVVYGTLLVWWFLLGQVLNKILPGGSPELIMEVPPYKLPHCSTVLKKLWMRMVGFLKEALPAVFIGVLIVNTLYTVKAFDILASISAPVMSRLFDLPKEAIIALAIGFLRKDVAMGLLGTMGLSIKQLVVASTVLSMFFPCIATFVVLAKELGARDTLKSVGLMLLSALTAGTVLNLIL